MRRSKFSMHKIGSTQNGTVREGDFLALEK